MYTRYHLVFSSLPHRQLKTILDDFINIFLDNPMVPLVPHLTVYALLYLFSTLMCIMNEKLISCSHLHVTIMNLMQ